MSTICVTVITCRQKMEAFSEQMTTLSVELKTCKWNADGLWTNVTVPVLTPENLSAARKGGILINLAICFTASFPECQGYEFSF